MDGLGFVLDYYGVSCIEEFSYISVFSDLCDEGCEDSVFYYWCVKRVKKKKGVLLTTRWMDWGREFLLFLLTSFHDGAVWVDKKIRRLSERFILFCNKACIHTVIKSMTSGGRLVFRTPRKPRRLKNKIHFKK